MYVVARGNISIVCDTLDEARGAVDILHHVWDIPIPPERQLPGIPPFGPLAAFGPIPIGSGELGEYLDYETEQKLTKLSVVQPSEGK